MTPQALRRTWFAGLWLMLPWPMIVFPDPLVPAIRYLLLGAAASAVALTEGAAGPVGPLVRLFLAWGLATTLGCWALAWLASRLLGRLPSERTATGITCAALAIALLVTLVLEPYTTSFGRAAHGGLLDILS